MQMTTVQLILAYLSSKVLDTLNLAIHSQINSLLVQDAKTPFEYDELDIDKFIQNMNQTLWNAICILTQSTSERQGLSKVTEPLISSNHIKKIRRFFLVCSVMFCTDYRCSFPLHTLLTDLVNSQGGSVLLIKILNRLGVCASSDTLYRHIQYKVGTNSTKQKFHNPNDIFVVVSAENIDFMHSYACVFKGNQMSSWHGTSIQAVTPKPSLSLAVQTNRQQQKRNMGPTLILTKSDPRLTDPSSYHPQTNSLQLSNTSGHSQTDPPHVGPISCHSQTTPPLLNE